MRILDKNKDYYDYAAEKEDGIFFDRSGSVLMERDNFVEFLKFGTNLRCPPEYFYFLIATGDFQTLVSYNINLDCFNCIYRYCNNIFFQSFSKYNILDKAPLLIMRVVKSRKFTGIMKEDLYLDIPRDHADYMKKMDWKTTFYNRSIIVKPILKNMGLSGIISAKVICQDLESWFFHNRVQPKPEPIPDEMKAANHGFDKNSFRGKFSGRKFNKKQKRQKI